MRKVTYQRNGSLNLYESGFDDIEEMKTVNELRKKREGWFHQWIDGEKFALIENKDGEIEKIEARYLRFID